VVWIYPTHHGRYQGIPISYCCREVFVLSMDLRAGGGGGGGAGAERGWGGGGGGPATRGG
jgi:hypothetical protein